MTSIYVFFLLVIAMPSHPNWEKLVELGSPAYVEAQIFPSQAACVTYEQEQRTRWENVPNKAHNVIRYLGCSRYPIPENV